MLGRTYFRGMCCIELAIRNSKDKDAERIKVAQHIFADNPYTQEGIKMLREITENSPMYSKAFKMLTLNLPSEDYYEMFHTYSDAALRDTEMLNRTMYHNIANEISILKSIAYRIIYQSQTKDEILSEIIEAIEEINEQIRERREQGKADARAIPENDYKRLMETISQTAHDISDFVNNELAAIESKIRRVLWNLSGNSPQYPQFQELLDQLEFTQSALNDLKSLNEGVKIKSDHFRVKKLFEKWEKSEKVANAVISLNIENEDSEFNGDEEKIKSILNELVENSLKHNSDQEDLEIRIAAKDVINPSAVRDARIPGHRNYLFIEFTDNGRGIKADRKERIFLPLETTSKEGEGSGLGLFIIRKTLIEMKGHIYETGEKGARFEMYIPYIPHNIEAEEEDEYLEGNREYSLAVG